NDYAPFRKYFKRDMHGSMVSKLARLGLLTDRVRPRLEKLGVSLPAGLTDPPAPRAAGPGSARARRSAAARAARARRARVARAATDRSPGPQPTSRPLPRETGDDAPSGRRGRAPARRRSDRADPTRG